MEEENYAEQYMSNNEDFTQQTALSIRLDTRPIIQKFEMYLRGYVDIIKVDEEGRLYTTKKSTGLKKANDVGIQSIMSWISNLLNAQVVQGNFHDHEALGEYMKNIADDFTDYLHLNINKFKIDLYEVNGIVDVIMNPIYAFLTRLVGNKERESFNATIRTTEQTNTTAKNGFKIPGFGG